MLHNLATIYDEYDRFGGREVTVRCRVIGDAHRGEKGGSKIMYEVVDPQGDLDVETKLSFWLDEPSGPAFRDLRRTEQYVLDALATGTDDVPRVNRGETLLVRGIPNISDGEEGRTLYINATSIVIREPDLQIGKNELRTQESCPRRYYLQYVKKVYYDNFPLSSGTARGDAVHYALEHALDHHRDRFVANDWTEDEAIELADEVIDEKQTLEQAKLTVAGIGLDFKEYAEEIVARLFTDDSFCEHVRNAESIEAERRLPTAYGYNGTVDIVLDGVPYDLKTSWNPDPDTQAKHRRQLQLYLFVLLLDRLEVGENLREAIDEEPAGYVVYPNLEETAAVNIRRVRLTLEDVESLLAERNEVAGARSGFAPPSPYGRDCDDCQYRTGDRISATGELLPSACTFHCQNERRWPCYELGDAGVESDCSLFERGDCEQRLEYREPAETDHFNALRSALREERTARETASDLLHSVDPDVLVRTGRLITGLRLAGFSQDTLEYETDETVVPAFEPGDSVFLEPAADGVPGEAVPYLGQRDGKLVFGVQDVENSAFLDPQQEYRAWYGFEPEAVSRTYLPYLDYAQRRETVPRFVYRETGGTDGLVSLEDPVAISEYLHNQEVFVDVPIRTDRPSTLAKLVSELVTAAYPFPDADAGSRDVDDEGEDDESETDETTVPEIARRALVLGATPELVELAQRATPSSSRRSRGHYRMDDFATGKDTIHSGMSPHRIQQRLLESRSIVSSVRYAIDEGIFHELVEGDHDGAHRDHSEKFFDVVVILGAQRLTEPVYHYLRDVADRVVAIGDVRAQGPEMMSTAARERGLDRSYFEWAHERYAAMPVEEAASLQVSGEANAFIRTLFPDDPFEPIDADLSFLGIQGGESVDVGELTLRASVRTRDSVPHEIIFDVTHTTANPFEIQQAFVSQEYLDANMLPTDGPVLIDDFPLELVSKTPIDGDVAADSHRITIRASADAIAAFERTFLYNTIEAKIVAQTAKTYDPDVVVTPFEAHANELRRRLDETGIDVPVKLARDVGESVTSRAIVSFAATDEILHPPLTEPETLYAMLSCAQDLLLIGHEKTLQSKDALEELVTEMAEPY